MSLQRLLVVGLSHRTAPVDVRQSVAFPPEEIRAALEVVRGESVLDECVILSTCNRTEVYAVAPDPADGEQYVRSLIARLKGADTLEEGDYAYVHTGADAALHLFRVAAGLDSMTLGEVQILGQVKAAYDLAHETRTTGALLHHLFPAALHTGKRARAETEIGAGSVSVASAAVALAGSVFESLAGKRVLVVGAGDTGRLVAEHFAKQRPAELYVANRTLARACTLADALGGKALPLSDLATALRSVDVVVSATSCPGFVITREMVAAVLPERRGKPLLLVDVAVPRDVQPEAGQLEDVFAYSIDDLKAIVDGNLARRKREARKVETIVRREVERLERWDAGRATAPVVVEIRDRFERIRREELARHAAGLAPEERARVEALTRGIVNKLLHLPTTTLKSLDLGSEEGLVRLDALRQAFGVGGD